MEPVADDRMHMCTGLHRGPGRCGPKVSRFEIVPSAGWCISFRSDPIADRPVKHSIEPGKMLVVAQGRAVNERNPWLYRNLPALECC